MEPGKGRSRQAPAHGCNTCCSRLWVPTETYTCTFRATDLTSVIRNPLWFRWWKTRQRSTENKTINTHVLIAQNWQLLTFGMLQDFFKTKNNPISSISEFYTCLNSIYCSPLKRGMLSWIWYVSFQSLKQCVCIHTHTHTIHSCAFVYFTHTAHIILQLALSANIVFLRPIHTGLWRDLVPSFYLDVPS